MNGHCTVFVHVDLLEMKWDVAIHAWIVHIIMIDVNNAVYIFMYELLFGHSGKKWEIWEAPCREMLVFGVLMLCGHAP